jgi:hypothetical protein
MLLPSPYPSQQLMVLLSMPVLLPLPSPHVWHGGGRVGGGSRFVFPGDGIAAACRPALHSRTRGQGLHSRNVLRREHGLHRIHLQFHRMQLSFNGRSTCLDARIILVSNAGKASVLMFYTFVLPFLIVDDLLTCQCREFPSRDAS